jgi:hypothetical protein
MQLIPAGLSEAANLPMELEEAVYKGMRGTDIPEMRIHRF